MKDAGQNKPPFYLSKRHSVQTLYVTLLNMCFNHYSLNSTLKCI